MTPSELATIASLAITLFCFAVSLVVLALNVLGLVLTLACFDVPVRGRTRL